VSAVAGELGFSLAERCQVNTDVQLVVSWSANGQKISEGSCGGTFRPDPTIWQTIRSQVGAEIEFVATVSTPRPAPAPDGTFAVAVMRRVDFGSYLFPPRPAQLRPLDPDPAGGLDPRLRSGRGTVIDSVPGAPNAPVQLPGVLVSPDAPLDVVAQTPGILLVYVDNVAQARAEWWDYDQTPYGATLQPGELSSRTVTLRLVPQHMTGAWRAVLRAGPA
jgi:hypothetical protein